MHRRGHGQFTRYWPYAHQADALPTEAHLQILHVALILLELADDRKHRQKAVSPSGGCWACRLELVSATLDWLERAAASLMLPGLVFLPHLPSSLFFRSHRMVSIPNSKNPEASSADNLNSLQRWEPRPHTQCLRAGAVRKTVF